MSAAKRVAYFYDENIGNYYYGSEHPMKPHRVRLAHSLILSYGLYKKMAVYRPQLISEQEMMKFHADDYVHFLKHVSLENMDEKQKDLKRFMVDTDCPVFDGLFNYCQTYAGGSVGGAYKLNKQNADVVVNWAGGLHHAKKAEASGFCYVNDIVLAILELLKVHARVLYVDIDVHHGDGVEEAFYTTDRVMTVSFHKFGDFFPGTGDVDDTGAGKGKNYALNFPLKQGMDDETYTALFQEVMGRVMETYKPSAIVLQSGADSLSGDRLGCFNLTLKGHAACLEYMKSFDLPLLVLGGGGYTVRNVARCWAYETGVLLGEDLPNEIPQHNQFYDYYGPDYALRLVASQMENGNSQSYLNTIKSQLFETLRRLPDVSIQYTEEQVGSPDLEEHQAQKNDNDNDDDARVSVSASDAAVQDSREFYENDNDNDKMDERD